MKILLLSDTHSDLTKPREILRTQKDFDMLCHCGDYQYDARHLSEEFGIPTVSVKGNSDNCRERDIQVVETPAGRILLTHGHMEIVQLNYDRLLYLAEENQCIAACFGHTHRAVCEKTDDIWVINPGSLSEPRDGTDGTYAILQISEDSFEPSIIKYEKPVPKTPDPDDSGNPPGGKKTESKVKGGFLRGLLNYSDRF